MLVGSINHIVLTVNELERSRAFYDRILAALGYRQLGSAIDSLTYVGADGLKLMFVPAGEAQRGADFDRYRVGLHHLAFNAPDRDFVDDFFSKLLDWGVTILDEPGDYPQYAPGYYALFFADPDGMKLELVHVPKG